MVKIADIVYDPWGSDVLGEHVVLRNGGASPVNLRGWMLRDASVHRYYFGDFVLAPGRQVRLWTGSGADTDEDLFWGHRKGIWNNDVLGDEAVLHNAGGGIEDRFRYPAPPPPPPDLEQLVARLAPEVRLHPDEENLPSSTLWYLPRVQMRLNIPGGSDVQVRNRGELTGDNVAEQEARGQRSGAGYPSDFFLEIPDDDEKDATRRGDLASAPCYVHVVPGTGDGSTRDIQYWFFFPYNGDITTPTGAIAHEGDFEHISVRVSESGQVLRVFFGAHGEGAWHDVDNPRGTLRFNAEGRPLVYLAHNSHACYTFPGRQRRPIPLPDDMTAEGGPVWRTWERLERMDQTRPAWLRYSGLWGETGEFDFTSGPRGPAFQAAWNGDDGTPIGWIVFREGNNGTQGRVGQTTDAPGQAINLKDRPGWTNDEARSVELLNVRAGTVLTVYDSPSGSRSDDWTRITVKQDIPGVHCIGTFESSHENDLVRVEYRRNNGLDGKVSRVTVERVS